MKDKIKQLFLLGETYIVVPKYIYLKDTSYYEKLAFQNQYILVEEDNKKIKFKKIF